MCFWNLERKGFRERHQHLLEGPSALKVLHHMQSYLSELLAKERMTSHNLVFDRNNEKRKGIWTRGVVRGMPLYL